jgi:hypothetical protein
MTWVSLKAPEQSSNPCRGKRLCTLRWYLPESVLAASRKILEESTDANGWLKTSVIFSNICARMNSG